MNVFSLTYNLFREKTSIAWAEGGSECVVVDPGFTSEAEREDFLGHLKQKGLTPKAILLTHAHLDHIAGVGYLVENFPVKVYMSPLERPVLGYVVKMAQGFGIKSPAVDFPTVDISDGDILDLFGLSFEVISTPGHTPGGVSYLEKQTGVLFGGDTLFCETIGRTDLPLGDYDEEIRSIMERLILLDPDTKLITGHGPNTTIGHEREHNPFLEPFNEPEEDLSDLNPVVIHGE